MLIIITIWLAVSLAFVTAVNTSDAFEGFIMDELHGPTTVVFLLPSASLFYIAEVIVMLGTRLFGGNVKLIPDEFSEITIAYKDIIVETWNNQLRG